MGGLALPLPPPSQDPCAHLPNVVEWRELQTWLCKTGQLDCSQKHAHLPDKTTVITAIVLHKRVLET